MAPMAASHRMQQQNSSLLNTQHKLQQKAIHHSLAQISQNHRSRKLVATTNNTRAESQESRDEAYKLSSLLESNQPQQ